MTTTPKPMTLAQLIVRDVCETDPADPDQADTACIKVSDLETIINNRIDAELAKQREAATVAWEFQHEETGLMCAVSTDGVNTAESFTRNNPRYSYVGPLYRHPQQRNAAEVTDEMVARAYDVCDRYVDEHAEGEVSLLDDGQWNEMLRAALSAVASRDREDAEHMDADERAQFVSTIDDFEDDGETSTDYEMLMRWERMGLLECERFYVTQQGRKLFDAARRENKP